MTHVPVLDDLGVACEICGLPPKNRRVHVDPAPQAVDLDRAAPQTKVRADAPATSRAAAADALPRLGTVRAELLGHLARAGAGMTDDELEATTGRPHQTVSATRKGMVDVGLVEPMEQAPGQPMLRLTRSGSTAQVWTLTPTGRTRWEQTT